MVPGAVGLASALGIVTARRLAEPSLLEELVSQFTYRRILVDLYVTEEAKAFADRTSRAEFASGKGHELALAESGRR